MPAIDYCQPQVVRALEKDGWRIEDMPYSISAPKRTIYIDIQASRYSNGSQQKIMLAEVKCFPDRDSTTRELYGAIGQYLIYRAVLRLAQIQIPLYLVVPDEVYTLAFDSSVLNVIKESKIKLLVVNLEVEEIVKWIES